MKYLKENLLQHCTNKTERMLKHFLLYYKKYCRKLSKTFRERFMMHSLWKLHEMFGQVCGIIYWNISRKLPVKILETLHKILQKLFCKVSRNIQITVTNFLPNISTTLRKYFPKDYKKCCVKIPTIITRKVSDTFPEYFVYGLDRGHKHFTESSGKFGAKFIEIFHECLLLRYMKYYTKSCRNFSSKFLEIFWSRSQNFGTNISTTLQKYFPKDYKKFCVKIPTIIHRRFLKLFRNILCMVWTEDTNISRNVLASSEQHLFKYFRQASCEDTWNLAHKIVQKFFCKDSRNIHSLAWQFFYEYFCNSENIFRKITANVA